MGKAPGRAKREIIAAAKRLIPTTPFQSKNCTGGFAHLSKRHRVAVIRADIGAGLAYVRSVREVQGAACRLLPLSRPPALVAVRISVVADIVRRSVRRARLHRLHRATRRHVYSPPPVLFVSLGVKLGGADRHRRGASIAPSRQPLRPAEVAESASISVTVLYMSFLIAYI